MNRNINIKNQDCITKFISMKASVLGRESQLVKDIESNIELELENLDDI